MPLPAGMAAGAAAGIGKEALEVARGRRARNEERQRALAERETAKVAIIAGMAGQTGEELASSQTALAELAKIGQAEARQKTIRTAVRVSGVLLAVGGVAGGALVACDNLEHNLAPQVVVTRQEQMTAALENVQQRTDVILATGTGTGQAKVSTQVHVGFLGLGVNIPKGIVGNEATVSIPRSENVISQTGSTTLEAVQVGDQWHVLAMVDPRKIVTEVTGNQPASTDSGTSSGFFDRVAHLAGIDPDEETSTYTAAQQLAVQDFASSAAANMTQAPVLAALEANYVRKEINDVAGVVSGPAHDTLIELGKSTIEVEFVNRQVPDAKGQPTFIAPGNAQSFINLPPDPGSTEINVGSAQFSMSTPSHNYLSEESATQLAAIEAEPGYTLLTQPMGPVGTSGTIDHKVN